MRFEFAGRAHAEKFTPWLGINLERGNVNKRMEISGEKLQESSRVEKFKVQLATETQDARHRQGARRSGFLREEHVSRVLAAAAAVVEVEDKIVFGDEIARRKT